MATMVTKDIGRAAAVIAEGRVVAFPTGTTYGLAADALQGHAIQRVRNMKKRPSDKTFSIFLDESLWDTYLDLTNEEANVLSTYANTALTLLVHPTKKLIHLAQDGLVGLRVIDHPLMQQLASATKKPLTATSANIAGKEACVSVQEVEDTFPGRNGTMYDLSLGCILDGGTLTKGAASTIAALEGTSFRIVRQGSLLLPAER